MKIKSRRRYVKTKRRKNRTLKGGWTPHDVIRGLLQKVSTKPKFNNAPKNWESVEKLSGRNENQSLIELIESFKRDIEELKRLYDDAMKDRDGAFVYYKVSQKLRNPIFSETFNRLYNYRKRGCKISGGTSCADLDAMVNQVLFYQSEDSKNFFTKEFVHILRALRELKIPKNVSTEDYENIKEDLHNDEVEFDSLKQKYKDKLSVPGDTLLKRTVKEISDLFEHFHEEIEKPIEEGEDNTVEENPDDDEKKEEKKDETEFGVSPEETHDVPLTTEQIDEKADVYGLNKYDDAKFEGMPTLKNKTAGKKRRPKTQRRRHLRKHKNGK